MTPPTTRDLRGYGRNPPDPKWPGGARLALQIVMNYEEGGENTLLNGDAGSEAFLNESVGALPRIGERDLNVETIYEYGGRAGFWRLWRLFTARDLPITVYGVGRALELNPEAGAAMAEAGWEVASHAYRWIDYKDVPEDVEREHIRRAVAAIEATVGKAPVGWYTGRVSSNTRRLVVEHGGFLYDADSYGDDLPYWSYDYGRPHLVVPYTLDANDMRFSVAQGFNSGDQFFSYLRDAFDCLYAEAAYAPKMMSVGLHCRLVGRPGRFMALQRFIDHVARHPDVWICRREDIARHWIETHPAQES